MFSIQIKTPNNFVRQDLTHDYSAELTSGNVFPSNWTGIPQYSEQYMASLLTSPRRDFVTSPSPCISIHGVSYPPSPSSSSSMDSPVSADSDSSRISKRRGTQSSKGRFPQYHGKEGPISTPQTKEKQYFPCSFDGCPEVFSRKHDRMRHEVTQHGRLCEWACDQCRKFFATEKTLAKHKCTSRVGDTRWIVP